MRHDSARAASVVRQSAPSWTPGRDVAGRGKRQHRLPCLVHLEAMGVNTEGGARSTRRPRAAGVSLLELVVAVGIVAVLAACALSSAAETLAHMRRVLGG